MHPTSLLASFFNVFQLSNILSFIFSSVHSYLAFTTVTWFRIVLHLLVWHFFYMACALAPVSFLSHRVMLMPCSDTIFFVVASYHQQQQHNLFITSYHCQSYIYTTVYTRVWSKRWPECFQPLFHSIPSFFQKVLLLYIVISITMVRIDTFEYTM
jgi:hypothetical protein